MVSRRDFIKMGLAGAAGVAVLGGGYYLLTGGGAVPYTELLEEIKRELKEKIGGNLGTTLGNELESAVEDLKSRAPTLNLEDRVNVYNWSWYIDPRLNSIFSDVTGCRVIYSTFETSDQVWARLSNPPSDFDVAVPYAPLQEFFDPTIGGEYIQELNHDLIPNIEYLQDTWKGADSPAYDPFLKHHVPYFFGTTGVGWNTAKIEEGDRGETLTGDIGLNWGDIFPSIENHPSPVGDAFLEKYQRRVTMIPGSDTLCYGLIWLGHSINDVSLDDEDKLDDAVELFIAQKKWLRDYADASKYYNGLVAGTYWASMVWSGDLYVLQQENPDLEYSIPVEGSDLWVDVLAIPVQAPHPNGAHAFINFLIDPAVAAVNAIATWYAPPVEKAYDFLPDFFSDEKNNPPESLWGKELEIWRPWTHAERTMMTEKWREVELA